MKVKWCLLQKLGADCTVDESTGTGAGEVRRRGFGSDLPFARSQGIYPQWRIQKGCAVSGGSSCNGRYWPLHQPRKTT